MTLAGNTNSRVWLVTGCSSGLGKALTEELLNSGERVVATLRKPSALDDLAAKYPTSQLLVQKLDVTDAAQIKVVFEATRTHFGRLDVVVNNAGYGIQGEFEFFPEDRARKLIEVLLWGPANVTREAIKFFRDVNPAGQGGRILNISSAGGFIGFPTASWYHAGKFALEGLTEAVAQEMLPEWNIKMTIVEPGGFRTEWNAGSLDREPVHPVYDHPHAPGVVTRKMLEAPFNGDPAKGAKALVYIAGLEDPPIRIQLGTESLMGVRAKARKVIADGEKYEEIAHSTNADDVDTKQVLGFFKQ